MFLYIIELYNINIKYGNVQLFHGLFKIKQGIFSFPGPCSVDSVFRWSDGWIYFFSGASYYSYDETTQSIDSRYPRAINDHWRGVPNNIDGVFRYSDDVTYFFKGSDYYRFNDSTLQVDPGYPKKIQDFWKGIPNDIDDVIK